MEPKNHALVFGPSGLIGWSVVNELLYPYPSPSPFTRVTACDNRPLQFEDSYWPNSAPDRPNLKLVTHVNLAPGNDDLETKLQNEIDLSSVSHVYCFDEMHA